MQVTNDDGVENPSSSPSPDPPAPSLACIVTTLQEEVSSLKAWKAEVLRRRSTTPTGSRGRAGTTGLPLFNLADDDKEELVTKYARRWRFIYFSGGTVSSILAIMGLALHDER